MNAFKLLLIAICGLVVSFRQEFERCAILALLAAVILVAVNSEAPKKEDKSFSGAKLTGYAK